MDYTKFKSIQEKAMQQKSELVLKTKGGQEVVFSPTSHVSYKLGGSGDSTEQSEIGLGVIQSELDGQAVGDIAVQSPFSVTTSENLSSEYLNEWFIVALVDIRSLDLQAKAES